MHQRETKSTWRFCDREADKRQVGGRVRRGDVWGTDSLSFNGLELGGTLIPLNIIGHFVGFRAVVMMHA